MSEAYRDGRARTPAQRSGPARELDAPRYVPPSASRLPSAILRASGQPPYPRAHGVDRKPVPGESVGEYDGITRPGPLADETRYEPGHVLPAKGFQGGKYSEHILKADTLLYRSGAAGREWGEFYTESPPEYRGPRIHRAAKDGGETPAELRYATSFPKGTKVYRGPGPDGAPAVHIPDACEVPGARVVSRTPLRRSPEAASPARGRVAIPQSGGAPLPGDVRARMEGQLGADLSGVTIHTGAESARTAERLKARAFTDGARVHFAPGEYAPGTKEGDRLLGHELAHVVQGQRASLPRKADEGDDVAAEGAQVETSHPEEPAEKEADAVGEQIAENLHGEKDDAAADAQAQDGPLREETPPIAAKLRPGVLPRTPQAGANEPQRVFGMNGPAGDTALQAHAGGPGSLTQVEVTTRDKRYFDDALVNLGPRSMAQNPHFEADAMAFEHNLGALAFGHPVAVSTADEMAAKAKAYIQDRAGGQWDAASVELGALLDKIGKDNPGWSGSVGKAIKDVMAVFDQGNVAERMSHVSAFFVEIMGNDFLTESLETLQRRLRDSKMGASLIVERQNEMVRKARARGGKGNRWDIAPVPETIPETGERNPTADQWHTRADRGNALGLPKDAKRERSELARGGRTLAETGADMSPREEALHQTAQPGWDRSKDAVLWEEGTRIWVMNERDKWVQAQRKLSLPLGAGPSGSTNTIMQAAKMFGTDLYGARTAAIAYLLPPRHHTLLEILTGAAAFGCAFTPGQQMYRNIKPFTEEELRACGKDGKFPDETVGDETSSMPGAETPSASAPQPGGTI